MIGHSVVLAVAAYASAAAAEQDFNAVRRARDSGALRHVAVAVLHKGAGRLRYGDERRHHRLPDSSEVASNVQAELTKSFSSAADTAQHYPQYASEITAAAKTSFLDGANWAYAAGILAVLGGAALVFFMFPKKDEELALLASYHEADATVGVART